MGKILFPVGATFSRSLGSYVSRFSALFDFGLRNGRERVAELFSKAMAPHSSTPAWKIPWMEEPGGLQSMGSLRVGHD